MREQFPILNAVMPFMAVVFAALCIWLVVLIVNRRKRWAKWTLVALIGIPVLYVLGFGLACRLVDHGVVAARPVATIYRPMLKLIFTGPEICQTVLTRCGVSGADDPGWLLTRLADAAGLFGGGDSRCDADVPHRTSRP